MLCQFDKLIYPKQADMTTVEYMIAVYRPIGIVRDVDGEMLSQIKAVGCQPLFSLPRDGKLKQHMKNRYLYFNMLQLFIRTLDYPVAKRKRI